MSTQAYENSSVGATLNPLQTHDIAIFVDYDLILKNMRKGEDVDATDSQMEQLQEISPDVVSRLITDSVVEFPFNNNKFYYFTKHNGMMVNLKCKEDVENRFGMHQPNMFGLNTLSNKNITRNCDSDIKNINYYSIHTTHGDPNIVVWQVKKEETSIFGRRGGRKSKKQRKSKKSRKQRKSRR